MDRRTTKGLNALCGGLALVGVGGLGWIAYTRAETSKPSLIHERVPGLREARRRAGIAERRGDDAEAERQYRTALRLNPSNLDLRLGLARSLLALGKGSEARSLLGPIIAPALESGTMIPGGRDTLAWYGDLLADSKDNESAIRAYHAALPKRSDEGLYTSAGGKRPAPPKASTFGADGNGLADLVSAAHLAGGYAAHGEERLEDAARHFRRAISLEPRSVEAHEALAGVLFEQGRKLESWAQYETVKRLIHPGEPRWTRLADVLCAHAWRKEAFAMMSEAERAVAPSDAKAWLALGDDYANMAPLPKVNLGEPSRSDPAFIARAKAMYDRAEREAPADDAKVWLALATRHAGYRGAKDAAKALADVEHAKRLLGPRDSEATVSLAYILKDLGHLSEARDMMRQAVALTGPVPKAQARPWRRDFGIPVQEQPGTPARSVATGGTPGVGVH